MQAARCGSDVEQQQQVQLLMIRKEIRKPEDGNDFAREASARTNKRLDSVIGGIPACNLILHRLGR